MTSTNEDASKQHYSPSNTQELPVAEDHGDVKPSTSTVNSSVEFGDVQVVVPKEDPDNVMFLRKGFNQNIVAGLVAFTGPGLFNAMQGLGNAGGSDPSVRSICLCRSERRMFILCLCTYICSTLKL